MRTQPLGTVTRSRSTADRLLRAIFVAMLLGLAVGLFLGTRLLLAAPAPQGGSPRPVIDCGSGQ